MGGGPEALVEWAASAQPRDFAALAPLALEAAPTGDALAVRALGQSAADLADAIVALELLPGERLCLLGGLAKPMRVLIGGIPNVGKSTLINTLVGKRATRVADEAGVTRAEQRILLADDFYLYDTPGVLWPKIIVPESGYLLAASGAVGRNAYDEESVALELLLRLRQPYAALLQARYQLPQTLEQIAAMPEDALLQAIGQRRGCLLPGGRLNTQKAAEVLLSDFRSAALGPITLETPQQFAQWLRAAQQAEAERAAERAAARLPKPQVDRASHT